MDKVRGYGSYYKTKQTNSSRPFVSQTFQKCTTNSIDSRLSRRVSRTSRTIVSHDYPHVLLKHGNATSSGSLIAREVDMDRKIHRRMMDARYYLENGVAHPFTTGSRAQRSFRLPLFSSSSSSSPAHLSSSLPDPYPSAPFQRERERGVLSAGFGDQDRPALENECRPRRNHPPDAASYVPANACTWTKGKVHRIRLCGHPRSQNGTSISCRERRIAGNSRVECVHSNTWKRMERNVIVLAEWRTVSSSDGIERIASRTLDRRSLKRRSRIGLTMVSSIRKEKREDRISNIAITGKWDRFISSICFNYS